MVYIIYISDLTILLGICLFQSSISYIRKTTYSEYLSAYMWPSCYLQILQINKKEKTLSKYGWNTEMSISKMKYIITGYMSISVVNFLHDMLCSVHSIWACVTVMLSTDKNKIKPSQNMVKIPLLCQHLDVEIYFKISTINKRNDTIIMY